MPKIDLDEIERLLHSSVSVPRILNKQTLLALVEMAKRALPELPVGWYIAELSPSCRDIGELIAILDHTTEDIAVRPKAYGMTPRAAVEAAIAKIKET